MCDGLALAEETCASEGFDGGQLACALDCSGFVTDQCFYLTCGDGVIDPGEFCDGADLAGETCESLGFAGGALACVANCDGFDTTGCTTATSCGDGILELGELCDGLLLGDQDCVSQGFAGGALGCAETCDAFDTAQCF